MKTSVIDMRDMLAALTVAEVEKRLGEVPWVDSATGNYAAKNATVRYDETLLDVAEIKVLLHQRSNQSAGEEPHQKAQPDAPPATSLAVAPCPSAPAGDARLHGTNRLAEQPPRPPWVLFFGQFKNVLIMVLIRAAALAPHAMATILFGSCANSSKRTTT